MQKSKCDHVFSLWCWLGVASFRWVSHLQPVLVGGSHLSHSGSNVWTYSGNTLRQSAGLKELCTRSCQRNPLHCSWKSQQWHDIHNEGCDEEKNNGCRMFLHSSAFHPLRTLWHKIMERPFSTRLRRLLCMETKSISQCTQTQAHYKIGSCLTVAKIFVMFSALVVK